MLLLTPPVLALTGQYEFVQSTQFCTFAVVIPALLVVGGPWRWFGLTSNEPFNLDSDGQWLSPTHPRALDRLSQKRSTHKGYRRAVTLLLMWVTRNLILTVFLGVLFALGSTLLAVAVNRRIVLTGPQ